MELFNMFQIGDKKIGHGEPAYIIAEIGVNHNGDMRLAKKSIKKAAEIGADAVKFQTFNSKKLVSKYAVKAKYQTQNTSSEESQLDMLKKLELSYEDHIELKDYCEQLGIEFLSTPFDPDSAKFLNEIGVHAFKIGSGDLTNLPLLQEISTYNRPVLLSTGMGNLTEVEEAIDALKGTETAILHCTSNYPTPCEDVNLRVMNTMEQAFGKIVGYSDHTLGYEVTVAAVTLGAKVIEKHFTLDRDLPGPDHKASMNPEEFAELVQAIRNVEKSLGDGIKRCMPSEEDTKSVARKSLVVQEDLQPGDVLTEENLTVKRPGTGIPPKYYSLLIGKTVKTEIKEDNVLTWNDVL